MSAGLNFLQIINRVLGRLREGSVAANNSTDYSTFIGTLVNQVKAEIEDAFHWNSMRDTYSVTAVPGTTSYVLTGAGMNAVVLNGWNTTTVQKLSQSTNDDFDLKFFGSESVHVGPVEQYLAAGVDANYDLRMDVWPSPSTTNALRFNIYSPQADLSSDSTVPLVPQTVLIEETIARALAERGDEGATQPQPGETFIRKELLASAISREAGHDPDELDWAPE